MLRELLVVLSLAAAAPAQRADVTTGGQVVDLDTGAPVAGARVYVVTEPYPGLPAALCRYLQPEVRTPPSVRTDARGRFGVVLPAGASVAFAAVAGPRASLVSGAVVAGGFVRLAVRGTRRITGVVRERGTRRPAAGQEVAVFVPAYADTEFGLRVVVRCDAQGRYGCTVPLGTWVRLEARGPGWFVERYVHEDAVNDLEVGAVGPRYQLADGSGKPLGGVEIVDHTDPRWHTTTDADGRFSLTGTHSVHWVHAFAPGTHDSMLLLRPDQKAYTAGSGSKTDLRLVGADGRPLVRSRVVVAAIAQLPQHAARQHLVPRVYRTDGDGRVAIYYRRACAYLSVFVEVGGRFTWLFRGAPKLTGKVDLVVHEGARFAGQVVGGDRAPVALHHVALFRNCDDGSPLYPGELRTHISSLPLALEGSTGRGGRFCFDGLQPGRYVLVVHPEAHLPHIHAFVVEPGRQFARIGITGRAARGVVTRPGGEPAAGAELQLTPVQRGPAPADELGVWAVLRFGRTARTRADQKGRFGFAGLPAQQLRIQVMDGRRVGGTLVDPGDWSALSLTVKRPR